MSKKSTVNWSLFPVRRVLKWGFCLLICCSYVYVSKAQVTPKVNLNVQNISLIKIIEELRVQTAYNFLFNSEELRDFNSVNVTLKNVSLRQALDSLLLPRGLEYTIEKNTIIIKKYHSDVKLIKVNGRIVDEKGNPIPGATVLILGTTRGSATDANGMYAINVFPNDTLKVSFVGYKTELVEIKGRTKVNVKLTPEEMKMDEVVVTGYLNVRKESYTGTVTRVEGEELLKVGNRNVVSALQVFDPSFRIITNNEMGSNPNAIPDFYIRGQSGISDFSFGSASEVELKSNSNLPVFILDGLEVSVEKIYDMDPTRIKSMTILKDAAATAIYGSRASNGVVVVETVAPEAGKFNISYNGSMSITAPDLRSYDYFNAEEKLLVEELSGYFAEGTSDGTLTEDVRKNLSEYWSKQNNILKGVYTDWLALPLRTGYNLKHSLAVDGGNDNIRYGLNFSYDPQKGVMKGDYRKKYGVSMRIDYRMDKLNVINQVIFDKVDSKNSPYGSFSDYVNQLPYNELFDSFGNYVYKFSVWHSGSSYVNPMYEGAMTKNSSTTKSESFTNNLIVNYFANENFQVKGSFGIGRTTSRSRNFIDPSSGSYSSNTSISMLEKGSLATNDGRSLNWSGSLQMIYNRNFQKHNINVSLGMEVSENKSSSISANYKGFPDGNLTSLSYAQQIVDKPTESDNHTRLSGMFMRLNYSYKDIYLLDGSVRFDGSSEFGSDKKYAPFYALGTGVNFHNYEFLKDNQILTNLKFTFTFGQTGKVNFAPYVAKDIFTINNTWYATGMGVYLMALGNTDLTWEKKNSYDFSLRFEIKNGLLNVNANYYYALTKDLLTSITIPSSFGFNSYYDNLGEVENTGYELSLTSNLVKKGPWFVNLYVNAAHNDNKIKKISNLLKNYNDEIDDYYNSLKDNSTDAAKVFTKYVEGGSTTSIFGMKSLGIDPSSGDEVFVRRDGTVTYEWDASEQQVLGNTLPSLQGSFGINASWGNLSLFAAFMYEYGGEAYNSTLITRVESVDFINYNADRRVLSDRWQQVGDVTKYKDIADRSSVSRPSSRFIQKNNLLKFSSLSLSYTVRDGWIDKLNLKQVIFRFNMNDVAYWSTIKQERGTSYPFAYNFDFTLGISF